MPLIRILCSHNKKRGSKCMNRSLSLHSFMSRFHKYLIVQLCSLVHVKLYKSRPLYKNVIKFRHQTEFFIIHMSMLRVKYIFKPLIKLKMIKDLKKLDTFYTTLNKNMLSKTNLYPPTWIVQCPQCKMRTIIKENKVTCEHNILSISATDCLARPIQHWSDQLGFFCRLSLIGPALVWPVGLLFPT